ncbi:RNA methyltransferase, TrmH family, group 3 [Peptoanaerobacter stomatis]|uniref:RNA methyltransferase, TrmH family, group 3 n=1 Tax=Peptoanaerobacter stomatis TaxID=796937 RepID=G9XAQ0_9FIRM|nr:23S rRNA (guanosine(2251)-2'-O)-methyltransferase RlmB [Peptoanaerobacter stomatis]EHL19894.1 RNA methyltransferase, TrmH family, group 3 [Peptoanaerobacter stomatis]
MNYIIGKNPIIEAIKNDREIDTIYIKSGEKEERLKYIISIAKDKKILVKEVDKKKLDMMSENANHQGVLALISEYKYYEFDNLLEDIKNNREKGKKNLILILDRIEDVHNLGAIVRSAYCASADAIIIQNRRSAQINQTVEKTSAGATSYMKICRVSNLNDAIQKLKNSGIWIYALDMGETPYFDTDLSGDVALVVGNEGKGISTLVKRNSDMIISIPITGKIDSLNASVSASIAMFEVVKQRMRKK